MPQQTTQHFKETKHLVVMLLISAAVWLALPVMSSAQQSITAERQEELRYMVQQDCGSCHGMTLKGGLGPSLLPERISALPKEYLIEAISHGRSGTPMPPWAPLLTKDEIVWIVEQLQAGTLGQKK
jgi:cytochrome c55X